MRTRIPPKKRGKSKNGMTTSKNNFFTERSPMDAEFVFPADPDKWQSAYTADHAYYNAGPVARIAPLARIATVLIGLFYLIISFNLPPLQLFVLDIGFISSLDAGQINESLREIFKEQGEPLDANAAIKVEQSGSAWVIDNVNAQYLICSDRDTAHINVYKKRNGLVVLGIMLILSAGMYITYKWIKKAAFTITGKFFQEFYLPPESVDASEIIRYRLSRKIKLPMPFSELFPSISQFKYILVRDGEILKGDDWPAWMARNIGGPILLIVFDGSALYLERGNRFSRVVGPGVSFLERYETIKYALDLRAKSKTDSFTVWTKDGISIKFTVCIEYRIGNPQKISTKPQLLHPYDPAAVKKSVERYSLRWPDPTKEPSEFTWEDAVWGQVTGIVPDYVGSRFLDDLLVADRNGGQILAPEATKALFESLNGATTGFGVHVTNFQIVSVEIPPEVEKHYVQYWEAERQSRAVIMDGKARAFDIRAHERIRAEAQHDLILAIADGLEKNKGHKYTEPLLLSLAGLLDGSLNDPLMRAYLARETLETLEQTKKILNVNLDRLPSQPWDDSNED